MPFIERNRRDVIDEGLFLPNIYPGDLCYKYYKQMVDQWHENPRWTTAHEIFKDLVSNRVDSPDDEVAKWLAWQVFFQLKVMPYELQKQAENGDI